MLSTLQADVVSFRTDLDIRKIVSGVELFLVKGSDLNALDQDDFSQPSVPIAHEIPNWFITLHYTVQLLATKISPS